jgi:hypothetical protein
MPDCSSALKTLHELRSDRPRRDWMLDDGWLSPLSKAEPMDFSHDPLNRSKAARVVTHDFRP